MLQRHQPAQVAVPVKIPCQQRDSRAAGQRQFRADDRFHAGLAARLLKLDGGVQPVPIGQRDGRHVVLLRELGELLRLGQCRAERIGRTIVQGNVQLLISKYIYRRDRRGRREEIEKKYLKILCVLSDLCG